MISAAEPPPVAPALPELLHSTDTIACTSVASAARNSFSKTSAFQFAIPLLLVRRECSRKCDRDVVVSALRVGPVDQRTVHPHAILLILCPVLVAHRV